MGLEKYKRYKTELQKTIKTYYKDKKIAYRYVIAVIILLLLALQFVGNHEKTETYIQGLSDINYDEINFAGIQIPFDGQYFFNKERLDREIALTRLKADQFVLIHKREKLYMPYIVKQLKKYNLPTDFQYLAVAESALRNVAYSTAGAAGIRQLIPATAKRYGLRVDGMIDERLDFVKSTKAAILYLQDLYRIFDNRVLVAAAYNRGENGLLRDMSSQYVDNYFDMVLNTETYRYVFRIAAIKEIMKNRYDYFDVNILGNQYTIPDVTTIKVHNIDNIPLRAKEQGYSYAMIKVLNPWIISDKLPEGKRELQVVEG